MTPSQYICLRLQLRLISHYDFKMKHKISSLIPTDWKPEQMKHSKSLIVTESY